MQKCRLLLLLTQIGAVFFECPLSQAQVATGLAGPGHEPSRTQLAVAMKGNGVVASDSLEASRWGAEILRQGGNAVDAAVGTAWMLAVTRPHFASLGGGGFLVFCPARGECQSLDYREVAPGEFPTGLKQSEMRVGARSAAVPGAVAGLVTAQKTWGTRRFRRRVLDRPITAAKHGVIFTPYMEQSVATRRTQGDLGPELLGFLGHCRAGEKLRHPQLAQLLAQIRTRGSSAFYRGATAQRLVKAVRERGGFWRLADLERYTPRLRHPLIGNWSGHSVITMGPPSSGGVLLLQILQSMETRASAAAVGSVDWQKDYARASALAFADRAEFLGDPDFNSGLLQNLTQLLDPARILKRMHQLTADTANGWHAPAIDRPNLPGTEGNHTTHLSVIDSEGNAVALTTTINDSFGSGVYLPDLGIVLNNEMDDFSAQPGVANDFGLLGSAANLPHPLKRPLSSMTPTIVRTASGGTIVLGAAGGPRIISAVAQTLIWRMRGGMSLGDAVAQPRMHHQWKPDELKVESGALTPDARATLSAWGMKIETATGPLARLYAAEMMPDGRVLGVADLRGEGQAAAISGWR